MGRCRPAECTRPFDSIRTAWRSLRSGGLPEAHCQQTVLQPPGELHLSLGGVLARQQGLRQNASQLQRSRKTRVPHENSFDSFPAGCPRPAPGSRSSAGRKREPVEFCRAIDSRKHRASPGPARIHRSRSGVTRQGKAIGKIRFIRCRCRTT